MNDFCPWCGARAIDVTTAQDQRGFDRRARYICAGRECHAWREGDGPEPEPEPKPEPKQGIIQKLKRLFA